MGRHDASRAAHRDRHPLRDPAARGRIDAGIVEADDDGLYVLKFRGAGQGTKALAAELVAGEIARALGLPVPELVFVELDPALGAAEPDPEIQELIAASGGRNLGMDFLPGALPFTPQRPPEPELAADVVWFDALVLNVDRTPRNPNLLRWHDGLWLIDHGAALYVHHARRRPGRARAATASRAIRDHVLLPFAGPIAEADARLAPRARRRRCDGDRRRAAGRAGPTRSAYAAHLAARLDGAARLRRGGRARARRRDVSAEPFQYAMCASSRASSAARRVNAGVVLFCRPRRFLGARARELDEALLAALVARLRPGRGARPARRRSWRSPTGDPEGGPSRRCRSPSASTG